MIIATKIKSVTDNIKYIVISINIMTHKVIINYCEKLVQNN